MTRDEPTKSQKIGFILHMRSLHDPSIEIERYYKHLHKIYDDIDIEEIDVEFDFYRDYL